MKRSSPYNPATGPVSCDILVAGGGVVGLWVARLAHQAGMRVVLAERDRIGGGASGGLLGALMPHMPERWNPKKQFQFDALVSLPARIAEIERETGRDCRYRRCGRLLPLTKPHHATLALERQAAAETHWNAADARFDWHIGADGHADGWPARASMPHGVVFETLSARVDPRAYGAALAASIADAVALLEGEGLETVDETAGLVTTTKGRPIRAGHVVIAAGHDSFGLLGRLTRQTPETYGTAVKGQAALLRADIDPVWPLIFRDGLYLVPHEGGRVAVGSTSETRFDDGFATDAQLDAVIAEAAVLCPQLTGAPVIERWANLRPKAVKRDPMIGRVPGFERLFVATGGFKITFGIAHEMARCALDLALRDTADSLPDSFRLETHLN